MCHSRKQVQELLTDMSVYVKANEPGTLRYHLQRETKGDTPSFVMLETYVLSYPCLLSTFASLVQLLLTHVIVDIRITHLLLLTEAAHVSRHSRRRWLRRD
jgi:hypothetical protein